MDAPTEKYQGYRRNEIIGGFGVLPSKTAVAQAALELGHRTVCVQELMGWTRSVTWHRMMRKRSSSSGGIPKALQHAKHVAWEAYRAANWQPSKELNEALDKANKDIHDWLSLERPKIQLNYPKVKEFKDRPKEERDNALDLAELFMHDRCTCTLRGITRDVHHWRRAGVSEADIQKNVDIDYENRIRDRVSAYFRKNAVADDMKETDIWSYAFKHVENLVENGVLHQFYYYVVLGKEE